MSEQQTGWICPLCGVGNAPWAATCGSEKCRYAASERKTTDTSPQDILDEFKRRGDHMTENRCTKCGTILGLGNCRMCDSVRSIPMGDVREGQGSWHEGLMYPVDNQRAHKQVT